MRVLAGHRWCCRGSYVGYTTAIADCGLEPHEDLRFEHPSELAPAAAAAAAASRPAGPTARAPAYHARCTTRSLTARRRRGQRRSLVARYRASTAAGDTTAALLGGSRSHRPVVCALRHAKRALKTATRPRSMRPSALWTRLTPRTAEQRRRRTHRPSLRRSLQLPTKVPKLRDSDASNMPHVVGWCA